MLQIVKIVLVLLMPLAVSAGNELMTVKQVEIKKYIGTWYEIARYNHFFEKGCIGVKVNYTLREDADIDVENICLKEGGKKKQVEGKAWVKDKANNAKLKVRFFWPFSSDYWIISLGDKYEYAVVSEPDREYLWILSRTPQIQAELLQELLADLKTRGFDTSKLIYNRKNSALAN